MQNMDPETFNDSILAKNIHLCISYKMYYFPDHIMS